MKEVIIGYWRSGICPELPMPEPDTPGKRQKEVISRLEIAMATNRMIHYRGWSTCRLCGRDNGSRDLVIVKGNIRYKIPEGYLHYLKVHRVGYDPMILSALEMR